MTTWGTHGMVREILHGAKGFLLRQSGAYVAYHSDAEMQEHLRYHDEKGLDYVIVSVIPHPVFQAQQGIKGSGGLIIPGGS